MRVLVIPSWYPSPDEPTAGVFIQQQVRALAPHVDVAVLHVDPGTVDAAPSVTHEDGATVVRARVAAPGLKERYFDYRRAGREAFEVLKDTWGMPDIVHVQALWPAGLIARDIKQATGIPYIVTEHSEEYLATSHRKLVRTPGMLPLVLKPLARGASGYIAVSRFLGDRLVELGLTREVTVIPNVVPECDPSPLPTEPPFGIVHVSVMGPAKNLESLLRAIDILRRSRQDFVLRLVGDGECRPALEHLAADLQLGALVEFTGMKSMAEVQRILAESAFAVVSSAHETFSVAAAEALMCGRPVVSTRCGGPEEFITPGVGRLVDGTGPESLAEGLDWMLEHFGEYGPDALNAHACSRFAPDVIAGQLKAAHLRALRSPH